MKKLLIIALVTVVSVSFGSCKKDEMSSPSATKTQKNVVESKEHSGWD